MHKQAVKQGVKQILAPPLVHVLQGFRTFRSLLGQFCQGNVNRMVYK